MMLFKLYYNKIQKCFKITLTFCVFLLLIQNNAYSMLNCSQDDNHKDVTISNSIKLNINNYKNLRDFPINFYVTDNEEFVMDIETKEKHTLCIFDKVGKLRREIELTKYSEDFRELGSVYSLILKNDTLAITGHNKFFLLDIKQQQIIMKSESGLPLANDEYGNYYTAFRSKINGQYATRIKVINPNEHKYYFHPLAYGSSYDLVIIDSLILSISDRLEIAKLDTNLLPMQYPLFENEWKYDENKIIGGKTCGFYVINYSTKSQNNVIFYTKPIIQIVKYNRNFAYETRRELNYNIKISKFFKDNDGLMVTWPGGLLFHYNKNLNKLFVLYFTDVNAYIGEVELNW